MADYIESDSEEEYDVDNFDYALPNQPLLQPASQPSTPSYSFPRKKPHIMIVQPDQIDILKTVKNWTCVYPCYIDCAKTTTQGRLLAKANSISAPSCFIIAEAASKLGFPVIIGKLKHDFPKITFKEMKKHPRDQLVSGRVKICMNDTKGNKLNRNINTKRKLLIKIAQIYPAVEKEAFELDPNLAETSRESRSEFTISLEEKYGGTMPATAPTKEPTPNTSSAGGSSKKKKGKAKRKIIR